MQGSVGLVFLVLICSLFLVFPLASLAEDTTEDNSEKESQMWDISGEISLYYTGYRADSFKAHYREAYGEMYVSFYPHERLSVYSTLEKSQYDDLEISDTYLYWQANQEGSVYLMAGEKYIPFGDFDTAMISSPLTENLGWTSGKAVVEAYYWDGNTYLVGYAFKGESSKTGAGGKHNIGYGVGGSYTSEDDKTTVGADYISNLAESDWFYPNDVGHKIPAIALHGQFQLGRTTFFAEHVSALRSFKPDDLSGEITEKTKPNATQFEANFALSDDQTLAVAFNQSRNAEELSMTEKSVGVAYSQRFHEKVSGTVELSRYKDYDGEKGNVLGAELSFEFY